MEIRKHTSVTSHFFKVMIPGFHHELKLPPAVSKEVEKQKSRRAILESRLGRWEMGLCINSQNGLLCFTQGWPLFVDRHSLGIGDFIVFKHTSNLHFNVSVFDPSACEKEFHDKLNKDNKEKEANITNNTRKRKTTKEAKNLQIGEFERIMVPSNARKTAKVNIPTKFMKMNKLGEQKCASLRDYKGREWAVALAIGSYGLRLRMHTGWHDFYVGNGLKNGDRCVFKLKRRMLTPTTLFFDVKVSSKSSN